MVKSHKKGANITIMNTLSTRMVNENGKMEEVLTLVYKDVDTGLKYKEEIVNPDYTFYVAKEDHRVSYPRLFVEKDTVEPVTCPHDKIEGTIAKITGNMDFFKQNIQSGNRGENKRLHTHPDIFRSDIHIEDYYRFLFNKYYQNELCSISKSFLDIEVDGINMAGDFPQLGECPINAITTINLSTNTVWTFLLRTKGNDQIDVFMQSCIDGSIFPELKQFVIDAVGGPEQAEKFGLLDFKYNILFYEEEDEIHLIADLFKVINNDKPDFCMAWNMSFDIPYIIERIKKLGYDPTEIMCHPDFEHKSCFYFVDQMKINDYAERGDFACISSYTAFIDQMIQYASRRKGQSRPISYSLDYTGETVAKVKKLDYKHITTNIVELPYKDYKTFVFYNIMDVIVQVCIEKRTDDINYMFSKALINNTRYAKVHRQTIYLSNRGMKDFDNAGFIMGNNVNKFNPKPETKFPGAFVAQMDRIKPNAAITIGGLPTRLFDNCVDYDYASLYPSIYRQFNLASNTQIGLVIIPEQVSYCENRQNDTSYSRGGQFLEDFQSNIWLESGTRWFNLPNFIELYHDVENFYTREVMPARGLRNFDRDTGLIIPLHFMENKDFKIGCPLIFDSNKVEEKYVPFNKEKALEWIKNASANINQQFK